MKFLFKIISTFTIIFLPFFSFCAIQDKENIYDLVAIGEAMVDVIEIISDEKLKEIMPREYSKGDTLRISNSEAQELMGKLNDYEIIPGGSEANMAAYFAALGGRVGFNSVVADDKYGILFKESLERFGVEFLSPLLSSNEGSTALCITFITPDKDRTFAVDASISKKIDNIFVDFSAIAKAKLFYTDASNLDGNKNKSQIVLKALKTSKENDVETVFNLNNNYFVNTHRDEIISLLPQIDILIGSEKSFDNLFRAENIDLAIDEALKKVEIVVVTLGRRGAIIANRSFRAHVKTKAQKDRIIDTTGAGDAFAAGFLFARSRGKNLKDSAEFGSLVAAQALYLKGGRPKNSLKYLWNKKF